MLGRRAGGLFVFVSDRDSVFRPGSAILAWLRGVWPRFCPVQTLVFSEIFLGISGSRVRREEIWDSGNREPDPTILRRRQRGFRTIVVGTVGWGLARFFLAACSSFLDCRPRISPC